MQKKLKALVIASLTAVATPSAADAADFIFNYSTQSGIAVNGVVSATDLGGFYSVDNVTGVRNGATITGYDFFDDTPQSFNFNNGYVSNVDFSYYVGDDNFEVRFPGSSYGTEFKNSDSSLLVANFSLSPVVTPTPAVPEPATWAMMILGMGAIGLAMRRQNLSTRVAYLA